ncbi:hypothetical protein E4T56_gene429 [Termitomyces sp. T112]|nr:hypothetical protein E4T56_gene429 [Termitomyces sp. T112]
MVRGRWGTFRSGYEIRKSLLPHQGNLRLMADPGTGCPSITNAILIQSLLIFVENVGTKTGNPIGVVTPRSIHINTRKYNLGTICVVYKPN